MSGEPAITVELDYDRVRVRFGELTHLSMRKSMIFGVQSWRHGDNNYFIQFTSTTGAEITSDYDDQAKWEAVLRGLRRVGIA